MKDFLIERGKEPSTWRGLVWLATALGIVLSPDQQTAIISAGAAVVGAIGALIPDR